MAAKSKSRRRDSKLKALLGQHTVLSYDSLLEMGGGKARADRVRESAKYYARTGKLRHLTRGLYAVVPHGADPSSFLPDPYLVAAALRPDAVLSHHSALDLLGVARSVFHFFPYLTNSPRRTLRLDGREWPALSRPNPLAQRGNTEFGVVEVDRRGTVVRVTGPERTLVDGFLALRWVGGLEEHTESAAGFFDLDLDLLDAYLTMLGCAVAFAAVGWFLERHPQVAGNASSNLRRFEERVPKNPAYLGPRERGGRLERRWNLVVPSHLSSGAGFEGSSA